MTEAQKPQAKVKLMLVDDHEVVRVGLSTLLERTGTIHVVGEAGTVASAIAGAARCAPDVILMDLRLPDGSGVEACREILSLAPTTRILFLTSYSDEEAVMLTVLAGACGYLLKDIDHHALVRAVHDAANGQRILDPKVEGRLLDDMEQAIDGGRHAGEGQAQAEALSPQEGRILALVVKGQTNKEIASALALSEKTVKNYLSNAFQKLRVKRRAHAATVFAGQRRNTPPK